MAGFADLSIKRVAAPDSIAATLNTSRGVQVTKNVGDAIVYKPTIRNSSSGVVRVDIWAQLGDFRSIGPWGPLAGSEVTKQVDLPPGDTVVVLNGNIPANAVGAGQSYVYDCRIEIRYTGTTNRLDYWDNYDEVKVNGQPVAQASDLSVVGMAYA